jgi:hypothetical protein
MTLNTLADVRELVERHLCRTQFREDRRVPTQRMRNEHFSQ